ncbi:transcription elongation factor B polypeptide 1-like protein [Neocallimastix lanati (nom. inval.)]|uniref:Elongin-C n=1 Tax=Neocallimastix californiae TaxID=1754190 RepID=A0A1Y2E9N6_9FUNG|nr:transcription elongation factor B polypeptide 1-like protein [Neocallimastix sp. JGI-2020a]ORY68117.1 elongin C [Neocallimastix californiae]|eukprot:ORY68117.1 elongin C [Neocallimastix californiae]
MDDDNKSDTSNEDVVFDTVKLISSDGFEFIIDRKCAMISGTIKNMLSSPGQFIESVQNEIHFNEIRAEILEKVCEYFYYKAKYSNSEDVPEFHIDDNIATELLMVAEYLEC